MAGNNYYGKSGYHQGQQDHTGQWSGPGQSQQSNGGVLPRFSYSGHSYGFQSSGSYNPAMQSNPSHGVPQSDVRNQGMGNVTSHTINGSMQCAATSYPSPSAPTESSTPYGYGSQTQSLRHQPRDSVSNDAPFHYRTSSAQQGSRTLPSGTFMSGSPAAQNGPPRATQTSSPAAYQQAARGPPQQPYPQHYGAQQSGQDPSAPQTVDPSQFHDSYHEMQRRKAAEAEAQSQREAASQKEAEKQRQKEAEEDRRIQAAKKQAEEDRVKAEATRKANMELEMKEMFLKLRQYHQEDPELLSKMWAMERDNHLASEAIQSSPAPTVSVDPPVTSAPTAAHGKSPSNPNPSPRGRKKGLQSSGKAAAKKSVPAAKSQTPRPHSAKKPQSPPDAVSAPRNLLQTPSAPVLAQPGGSVSASKPSQPIWPADKKATLSAVASRFIQSVPGNGGRTLLPSDVSVMLDSNPTYVELCDAIEQRGFKFNRAALARTLLSTVPENQKKPNMPTNVQPGAPDTNTQHISPTPVPEPLTPATGNASNRMIASPAPTDTSSNSKVQNKQKENAQKNHAKGKAVSASLPQTKEDQARKRAFTDLVDLTQLSDEDEGVSKRPRVFGEMAGSDAGMAAPPIKSDSQPQAAVVKKPQSLPSDHQLRSQRPAEHLNRRHAKRRSKYNVGTIARDVLLSTGRHPEMRPLNAHLEMMKGQPLLLKDDVDLSTLRWDLVDPGGVAPGHGQVDELGQSDYSDDADDEEAMSDSDVGGAPVRVLGTPAMRVNIATPTSAGGGAQTTEGSGDGEASTAVAISAADSRFGSNSTSLKKRGRPRRPAGEPYTPRQQVIGNSLAPGSSSSAYTDLRRQNEQAGMERRRGRPVGWRKWMQKTPNGSSSAANKPARTPTSNSHKKPPPSPPDPTFPEFRCAWEGCTRSLHNLETLRRHIHKLHTRTEEGKHVCKWADCGVVETVRDGGRTVSRRVRGRYDTIETWKKHIETAHMQVVAWKLGDGPSAGLTYPSESASEQSESYLSDRDGRQVTPRVELPTGRGFTAVNAPAARPGRPSAIEQAREKLRAAEERRNRIGYGIDHGGARSIDDAMRATLDEDGDSDEPTMEVVDEADMDFAR